MTTDNDQIRALLATYEQALNTSDAALAASCYAPDGTFMPTTLPTAVGPDLEGAYRQIFDTIRLHVTFTIDELDSAEGTTAYAITHSNGTRTILASGAAGAESNREIFVFRRGSDGWKIAHYMFNKAA